MKLLIKSFAVIGILWAALSSTADALRLEGEPFRTTAPLRWMATNRLPATLMIYKVSGQAFSPSVLSNAMAIGSFRPINRVTPDEKGLLHFQDKQDKTYMTRYLKVSPMQDWVRYYDGKAKGFPVEGVPTWERAESLAMDYLERLGGDTNQVGRNTSRVEGTTTSFDRKGGEATNKVVHSRGLILYRQIDGFRFPGNSLSIEFGNQEKISNLEMTWKKLVPHHAYAVGSKDKMMAWIKAGKAVTLTPIEPLPQVKQLIVSDANLFYKLVGVRPSDAVVVPVVALEFAAERASGDAITFHLHCAAVDLDERTN